MKYFEGLNLKHLDESMLEAYIVTSLTEDDFYKFPMGQVLYDHPQYGTGNMRWRFKCRTKIRLADFISEADFMREYARVMQLKATKTELHYLRGTNEYDVRMFSEGYLNHLANLTIPACTFTAHEDGSISIEISGAWSHSMHGEMPVLKIINTLFYRAQLKKLSMLQREAIYTEGIKRLLDTIVKIKSRPGLTFSDFGNRRAFGPLWHEYVVVRCAEELPGQFIGTSNVALAAKYDLSPIGTCAHELSMGITAAHFNGTKESIVEALTLLHEIWWKTYGYGLSISLPDTYGTTFTLNALPKEVLRDWKGFRIDSKDPNTAIKELLDLYNKLQIDPKSKIAIPSDGLTPDSMISIFDTFIGQMKLSFGFGTHLTNNLGLQTLSIVMKPHEFNGKSCVKLSDNLQKGMGDAKEAYMTALEYHASNNIEQVV